MWHTSSWQKGIVFIRPKKVRELEFTIHELEKCIPTKPIKESWCPNRCPNCGANLGGECDDGYYENPYYEYCPQCRQILDYD